MSPNRHARGGVRTAGTGKRTSACLTSVLNLGNSPRVPGVNITADPNQSLPAQRNERDSLPTHRRIMLLLSMAVIPEERAAFRSRFRDAIKVNRDDENLGSLCRTPIGVIAKAFACEPFQLRSAACMFPGSRTKSDFLNEFYIMDVILNRSPLP